jgi:hypothetical protein
MNSHIMETIDPYDGGMTACRGCGARGTFTENPRGECPTPYKSDGQLLADAIERETALRAEVEALRKDAERYRWLREQNWNSSPICAVMRPKDAVKLGHDCPSLDRLDDAIDDAIEAGQ